MLSADVRKKLDFMNSESDVQDPTDEDAIEPVPALNLNLTSSSPAKPDLLPVKMDSSDSPEQPVVPQFPITTPVLPQLPSKEPVNANLPDVTLPKAPVNPYLTGATLPKKSVNPYLQTTASEMMPANTSLASKTIPKEPASMLQKAPANAYLQSADPNNNTKSPQKTPASLQKRPSVVKPPIRTTLKSQPRKAKDITNSRRFKNSLSFLLGSIGNDDDGDPKEKDDSTKKNPDVVVPEVGVKRHTGDSFEKAITDRTADHDNVDNAKFVFGNNTLPVVHNSRNSVTTLQPQKQPQPPLPRSSKRPCPLKLTIPTLKKTTSALFSHVPNNYLKGCKWSPDGLALITCSRDKVLRVFNVPDVSSAAEQAPVAKHSTANVVYDFAWNPSLSHMAASNCNFLVTCKDSPIQLADAFSGETKASFTAYDHVS